jgi:DNA-binding CsgD family transcriptional regulator
VVEEFELDDLIEPTLAAALYDLLDRGLLLTLSRFVDFARKRQEGSPVVDLATAEVAFREGFQERTFTHARAAAIKLPVGDELRSRAYCRAGHAAYFAEEIDAASEMFARARETARTSDDRRKAVWGQFLAALDRESDGAVSLLEEFEQFSGTAVDDLVRIQNGRLHLGMRLGSVAVGLRGAEAVANVVSQARDPIIRASFWHVYSGALRLAARYEIALEASDRALLEINDFDLSFATAYVQLTRAVIAMALSSYDQAAAALDEALEIGCRTGDVFVQLSERVCRARLALVLGDDALAVHCTSGSWPERVSPGLLGEFMACRAIALARAGETDDVDGLLSKVESLTKENEARTLGVCARALIGLAKNRSATPPEVVSAFRNCVSRWVLDPFVFAFKLDRQLARALYQTATLRPALQDLAPYVGDALVAPAAGATRGGGVEGVAELSPRESEVLDLLALGLTNAEIASRLFLTVPTVKVHVRSILRKLGVRTRTEAAVYAVTRRRRAAEVLPEPRVGSPAPE